MTITQRPFSAEQDKYLMSALARQSSENNLHVVDLPYRFSSWAFDNPENISLWFDENQQLVAWATLQTPFWTIDYGCHPAQESHLHQEILLWADQRAQAVLKTPYERPSWFVMVFSGQSNRIRDLENTGFKCQSDVGDDSWSKVLMRRSSQTPIKTYEPRSGFTVRSLAGESEVQEYVELHQSVFESKNMTVDWRIRTLQHPDYKPDLDIVVESPDGRLVAFCICWFNNESLDGHVEPLGSHKDFRQYGLGRAALSEGLRRLQSLGAQNIFVETDNYRNTAFRLYASFGFQTIQDVHVYRKDYETE
ncbi:MAG: GNAT family N-acetyltransferase [Anaerolineae bacterium]|nr:GNAT family N-acetyltransferase [Anaerolineae bacterium]